jgi:hypothetical protein
MQAQQNTPAITYEESVEFVPQHDRRDKEVLQ